MNKELLYAHLLSIMHEREQELNRYWQELMESNQQEGKSSAGDKHETAGAMVHLEMEKLSKQMEEGRRQLSEVEKFHPDRVSHIGQIQMGSLVQTTTGWYYLITSLGKLTVNGEACFVLSGASPLGRVMMGRSAGEVFSMGDREMQILLIA
jgi:transcription elongation GreA/GreB family factor